MKKTIVKDMIQKRFYIVPTTEVIRVSSSSLLVTSWPTTGNSSVPEVDDDDDGLYGD